jgi:hypothetical protein
MNASTEDRARILRMVAAGKLSAEEAADLLEALQYESTPSPRSPVNPESPRVLAPGNPNSLSRRFLLIQVSEGEKTKVNLRIPLALARAAGRFIPRMAQEHLDEYDINLKELMEDLGSGLVEGPLLDIKDEDTRVLIEVG